MATVSELARARTDLGGPAAAHLQRLVGAWGPLADLCFADLLLLAPRRGGGFVVVGQVRPTTNQTVYRQDLVGDEVGPGALPLVEEAWRT
ncbi:MAG: histidine kinase N-terminal domain-containing protein, partial [Acidimicrobiia bacterium]